MRKLLLLGAIFLGLAGSAQARLTAGGALLRAAAQFAKVADVAQPACPAGVPVQVITVVNRANVQPMALAKVERAVSDQSMQLRAAWGTPCVQFGSGGWPLYLKPGGPNNGLAGVHRFSDHPYAIVWTAAGGLSRTVSHETLEMLVDPTVVLTYGYIATDGVGVSDSGPLEVADPVEDIAYQLDGVAVSDFCLPAYFAGGTLDESGEVIAPLGAPGPYDEAGKLTGPWQTAREFRLSRR